MLWTSDKAYDLGPIREKLFLNHEFRQLSRIVMTTQKPTNRPKRHCHPEASRDLLEPVPQSGSKLHPSPFILHISPFTLSEQSKDYNQQPFLAADNSPDGRR